MSPNPSISPYDNLRVQQGLEALLRFDGYLLAHNLSERTLTHKLAEHYQNLFHEWSVDCEYNRNLGAPKKIIIEPKEILRQMADTLESSGYLLDFKLTDDGHVIKEQMKDLERQLRDPRLEYVEELDVVWFVLTLSNNKKVRKTIYPDIIIHHRGTGNNHIVLEAKKSVNTDRKARAYDFVKLMTLVSSSDFHYRRGYFIDLPVGKDFEKFKRFSSLTQFSQDVYKIMPEYKS